MSGEEARRGAGEACGGGARLGKTQNKFCFFARLARL